MDTPTPANRHGWSLAAIGAGIAGMALAASLGVPALAEETPDAPTQRDPGERHAAMVEELTEALDGDADAIAEALAALHDDRMADREARQAERGEARAERRSEHRPEDHGARRGDAEDRGPDGDGPGQMGDRQGAGPRGGGGMGPGDGTGPSDDCPLR